MKRGQLAEALLPFLDLLPYGSAWAAETAPSDWRGRGAFGIWILFPVPNLRYQ